MDSLLSSYDYDLPPEQIAQTPVIPRDSSRLLVVDSPSHHTHSVFRELPRWLQPRDLLVLNDTAVIPARLYGHKSTGAAVEVLLLEEGTPQHCWLGLVKPGKRFTEGSELIFSAPTGDQLWATVVGRDKATGGRWLQFHLPPEQPLLPLLNQYGEIPFPPYITESVAKPEQYQTVYAKAAGAVAAPTAGLHFTRELFEALNQKGIAQAEVTLHVGVGTFRPVETEEITQHRMHSEWVDVSLETVEKIRQTKMNGGRVIAVGTTVIRALEGAAAAHGGKLAPFCGKTELFIYPGYRWQVIDGLITNFHLPRSSLLMLVSALIGRERLLSLYAEAVNQGYRFYSFGDAMVILPTAVGQIR